MIPSTPRHSQMTRDQCLTHRKIYTTDCCIDQISLYQVRYALKRDAISPKRRSGRPSVLSETQIDELEEFICSSQRNRMMTFLELASVPFQHWGSIRSEGYCKIILPPIDGMIYMRPWLLVMQDNAPSHSAKDTMNEFRQRHITPVQWPACSPDLNPIESVWNIMKYYVKRNYPDLDDGKQWSEDELRLIVKEAWDSVSSEQFMELIKTMPARCKAVIDADGGYTKY